ncbi:TPA: glycosyltransferase family 2 protein [Vibrio parahaemolyticus]|nr:glycosyltransferase family 2 protein [Vibrio parahaemolyticus]
MKDNVLISIIIPHYNSVNKLKRLLTSIPKTNKIEIIVVDDNSISIEDAHLLKDIFTGVRFCYNNSGNKGAGASRNIGLRQAKGEWVLFSDADDYFLPDAFESMTRRCDFSYDCIYFKVDSLYEDSGKIASRHVWYNKLIDSFNNLGSKDIRLKYFGPWGKLIKRSFLNKYDIDFLEIRASEDIVFSYKVGVNAKNILCCDEKIYCITDSEQTLTKTYTYETLSSTLLAVSLYNNYVIKDRHERFFLRRFLGVFLKMLYKFPSKVRSKDIEHFVSNLISYMKSCRKV